MLLKSSTKGLLILLVLILGLLLTNFYKIKPHPDSIIAKINDAQVNQNINLTSLIKALGSKEIVYCDTTHSLAKKILEAREKILLLSPGTHYSFRETISSNSVLYIPKGATIMLANETMIDQSNYDEAVGDAVLKSWGSKDKPATNIHIILNGVIDGNKSVHPYAKGGVEGIDWKWVTNSSIIGNGEIRNNNGDGIDLDVVFDCYFEGFNILNNDGSGFHFGSPRPIESSGRNVIIDVISSGNGFYHKRNGFDVSWPNINTATYISCTAKNNYRNWDINGNNSVVINGLSIQHSGIYDKDNFKKALLFEVNGVSNLPSSNKILELQNDKKNTYKILIKESGYYHISTSNSWEPELGYQIFINDLLVDENKKIIFRNQPIKNLSSYFIKHLNVNDTISIMGNKSSQYKNENELVGFSPINVRLIKTDEKRNFYNYDYKILIFNITNNIKFLIYRIVIGLKSLFGISQNY